MNPSVNSPSHLHRSLMASFPPRGEFGLYLRSLRLRHQPPLTNKEIQAAAGVHERQMRTYELQYRYPTRPTADKLADLFGVEREEFWESLQECKENDRQSLLAYKQSQVSRVARWRNVAKNVEYLCNGKFNGQPMIDLECLITIDQSQWIDQQLCEQFPSRSAYIRQVLDALMQNKCPVVIRNGKKKRVRNTESNHEPEHN